MEDETRIDFPEVAGKTVAELYVYDDPQFGREVLLHFTDQTHLSISIGVKQTINAQFFKDGEPDSPISKRTH